MQTRAPLDVVVPFVHGKVCSLQGHERAILEASEAGFPTDPIVRAALRAGVDHTIDALESLMRALDVVRRKLEKPA
jgi:hypothetical protein